MDIIKKQSKGAIMTAVSCLLVLICTITYGINVSQAGYFKNASVNNMVLFEILTMVILCAVIAYANLNLKLNGVAGNLVELCVAVLRILACVLIAFCLINLVGGRVEGLGFIYFSNADVTLEVQTPANLASSKGTICNIVFLAITLIVNIVSVFFDLKKEA